MPAGLRLPRDGFFWLKALLLALVAAQAVQLLTAVLTPIGPVGRWMPRAAQPLPAAMQTALLTGFNPFGGTATASAAVATAPAAGEFTLFGTRLAGAGLPGSAIIAGADGEQASVAVGEDAAPGVRLVAVEFDRVTLERGGQRLQLVMEDAAAGGQAMAAPAGAAGLSAERLKQNVALAPRQQAGRVTGLLVSPVGDETVMQAAGLRSGDVIVAVNGRRVASVADATMLQAQVTPGARLSLMVERGAATVPVALNLAGS